MEAARRADGLWRVSARNERDAIPVLGYLQARDLLDAFALGINDWISEGRPDGRQAGDAVPGPPSG